MEKKSSNGKLIAILIIITAILFFVLAMAFNVFDNKQNENTKKKSVTEIISITYPSESNTLVLDGYTPILDEDGKKLSDKKQYFDFNINSKLKDNIILNYEVGLKKSDNCNLNNDEIKVYLEKQRDGSYSKVFSPKVFKPLTKKSTTGTPKGEMVILSGKYKTNSNSKYRLRVWVSDKSVHTTDVICKMSVSLYAKVLN